MTRDLFVMLGLALHLVSGSPMHDGASISAPAPSFAPALALIPGSRVYYVPRARADVFYYSDHYYQCRDGAWSSAAMYADRWTAVATERVPAAVRAVPSMYYKVALGRMAAAGTRAQ
jgi:hypothetical protein